MKLKHAAAGLVLAGVLALSTGGAVMAADGEGGGADGSRQRLRAQERICSETCTQGETCTQLQTRSRERAGQNAGEVTAVPGGEASQAGNSYGESGEGTGPGLNRQWGKSAR